MIVLCLRVFITLMKVCKLLKRRGNLSDYSVHYVSSVKKNTPLFPKFTEHNFKHTENNINDQKKSSQSKCTQITQMSYCQIFDIFRSIKNFIYWFNKVCEEKGKIKTWERRRVIKFRFVIYVVNIFCRYCLMFYFVLFLNKSSSHLSLP